MNKKIANGVGIMIMAWLAQQIIVNVYWFIQDIILR